MNIVAILTTYNRKNITIKCLSLLKQAADYADVNLSAVLVDDASTDGTANAVKVNFDWVEVISGDGNLYWNRGMHQAYSIALAKSADAYLWINDDTHITENAILKILDTERVIALKEGCSVVVTGTISNKETGEITYGGLTRISFLRRFSYKLIWDEKRPMRCDVAQGNFLLIPNNISKVVGNLDPKFEHSIGDIDYTLRVVNSGFKIYSTPCIVGYCAHNDVNGTYHDKSMPLKQRWAAICSKKGLPPASWFHFTYKHGGILWPLYFINPYVKLVFDSIKTAFNRVIAREIQ